MRSCSGCWSTWDASAWPRRSTQRDRGDRYLLAATVVFGLAVGNHSLTLLLAIPVGLYVLAVDPGIWRRGRLVLGCVAALALTITLVYLELPLRAGPFRAALVYGTPNTWDGFRYIVLAEQFQGSLSDPFGNLPGKFGELVTRTVNQFGILAPLIPVAFVVTAIRRPRYALLTGTAVAITCFFAASYVNADINRYYLGPVLIAWTWLAILAAVAIELLASVGGEQPLAEDVATADGDDDVGARPRLGDPGTACGDARSHLRRRPARSRPSSPPRTGSTRSTPAERTTPRSGSTARCEVMEPDAAVISLVELFDAAVVRPAGPGRTARHHDHRRPDPPRRERLRADRAHRRNGCGLTDTIDANLGKRPVYVIRLDPREVALLAERYELDYLGGTDATGADQGHRPQGHLTDGRRPPA